MTKIYKSLDEWIASIKEPLDYYRKESIAIAAWDARQPEIDQLKQQRKEQEVIIQKLNMDRYDLQKEVEQLKHEVSGFNYWKR